MRYRPEIDGLRAVAVIPVILFHAGVETFGGGFVGVDIFFVISGYLITTILLTEMDQGKFSLINFYERRARRILPALFFVIAVITPFAWMWLTPRDMKDFAQSIVAVCTFSSNMLFWRESGYFDTSAELKPLLHTWSLAVEEQYYIFFPLLLLLTRRFAKRWTLTILSIGGIFSLALAQWGTIHNPSGTFYLLPTRSWEILLGAFAAFYFNSAQAPKIPQIINNALSLTGLALVCYSIFLFDKNTPFPGLFALVPTMGTLLVILCGLQGTLVNRILSNRLCVGIGLISYSAYLWHQPLISLAKHRSLSEPPETVILSLCLASLPLAYLTWRFVENPFRRKNLIGRKMVFTSTGTVALIFLAFGAAGHVEEGFERQWLVRQPMTVQKPYNFLKTSRDQNANLYKNRSNQDNGDCRFNVQNITAKISQRLVDCHAKYGKGIAILGDSHAVDLFGVVTSANRKEFIVGATKVGCHLPIAKPNCQYDEFLNFVSLHPEVFTSVIFEKAGHLLLRTEHSVGDKKVFGKLALNEAISGVYPNQEYIRGVLDYLKKLSVYVPVLWFGPRVEPHINDKQIFAYGCDYAFRLRPNQFEIFENLDRTIEKTVTGVKNLSYLSQIEAFNLKFPHDFINCDFTYWVDESHLSEEGERDLSKRFDLVNYVSTAR